MRVHTEMELRRPGYVVVFVILLSALAISSSEARTKTVEMVLTTAGDCHFASSEFEPYMEENLACMKELGEREYEYEDEELVACIQKGNMDEAIRILDPEMKHELLNCLRRRSMFSRGSEEEARPNLIDGFRRSTEFISGGSNIHMRRTILSSQDSPPSGPAAAPSPSSESPNNSPSSSPSNAPMSSPTHVQPKSPLPKSKSKSKSKSKQKSKADDTDTGNSDSTDSTDSPSASAGRSPSLPRGSPKRRPTITEEEEENLMIIIAGIVGTGVAVVFTVALLLFCSCSDEENEPDPKFRQRGEKPLLVSMGEVPAGSSLKSYSHGNSATKQFGADNATKPPSFAGNLSVNPENVTSMAEAPRFDGKPSAMPPLKPPPGRSEPPSPPPPAPEPAPKPAPAQAAAAAPAAPPPPPATAPRAPPPPPMKGARPPPAPPAGIPGKAQAAPLGSNQRGTNGSNTNSDPGSHKTKLKPFFWDKVLANPGQSMVWHEISDGSFQFNEEMMESLFGYNPAENNKGNRKKDLASDSSNQYIQIIDARKAQNLSILLRALNVTTAEVVDCIQEGNPDLPAELVQTLLKMAPTTEEELKLRLFSGDLSQIGPAERFLKVLVETPFAFKRLECLLFMISMSEDVATVKESFTTLEVACDKLKNSRLFLKLLEAVLKTGNRMNDGTYRGGAQAFKLDTLLKLADVKGTDGKTTFLHFVVTEIIRSEGVRAARSCRESQSLSSIASADIVLDDFTDESTENYRKLGLQVVSSLSTELVDVKRAAAIDADGLTKMIAKLGQSLMKSKAFINAEMKNLDEDSKFRQSILKFLEDAETDITWIAGEEKNIMAMVKRTADYFHGSSGKDEGLRLFTVVRDFLIMLDKTCKQVKDAAAAEAAAAAAAAVAAAATNHGKNSKKETQKLSATSNQSPELRQRLFPAIVERRKGEDSSSSDEEDGDGDGDGESSSSSS